MDPEKCFDKPCVRGLRMPVASILGHLTGGMTIEELPPVGSEERSFLESNSNHVAARPASAEKRQGNMFREEKT
jgi:Protein of unknown function (DUF433)